MENVEIGDIIVQEGKRWVIQNIEGEKFYLTLHDDDVQSDIPYFSSLPASNDDDEVDGEFQVLTKVLSGSQIEESEIVKVPSNNNNNDNNNNDNNKIPKKRGRPRKNKTLVPEKKAKSEDNSKYIYTDVDDNNIVEGYADLRPKRVGQVATWKELKDRVNKTLTYVSVQRGFILLMDNWRKTQREKITRSGDDEPELTDHESLLSDCLDHWDDQQGPTIEDVQKAQDEREQAKVIRQAATETVTKSSTGSPSTRKIVNDPILQILAARENRETSQQNDLISIKKAEIEHKTKELELEKEKLEFEKTKLKGKKEVELARIRLDEKKLQLQEEREAKMWQLLSEKITKVCLKFLHNEPLKI